jgi:putative transposase
MKKQRNAEEVARLLRDADRDLAKGLTVSDFCRKVGVAQTTYYRWRQRNDPKQVGYERRCRELEHEVEWLKRLVAELLLEKTMLQEAAKKSGDCRPTTGCRPPHDRAVPGLQAPRWLRPGAIAFDPEVSPQASRRRAPAPEGHPGIGSQVPTSRISEKFPTSSHESSSMRRCSSELVTVYRHTGVRRTDARLWPVHSRDRATRSGCHLRIRGGRGIGEGYEDEVGVRRIPPDCGAIPRHPRGQEGCPTHSERTEASVLRITSIVRDESINK